jgi:DNA-binding NarL/FixJ family response regulator
MDVGPHLMVPSPQLLILNLVPRDAQALIEFATALRSNRGTTSIFVAERLDQDTLLALADADATVLIKPVHREQLLATVQLALRQQEHGVRREAMESAEAALARQRHLERTLRRIAETVAVAGIGPATETYMSPALPELRPREEEIVRLLLQHVRVPAIAQRLGINQQTVRNHLKGAFKRTGVRSQQELLDRFTASRMSPGPTEASL